MPCPSTHAPHRHYHLHVESRVYPSDEHIRQAAGVERARLERLRQSAATISIWSNYLSDITYVHTPAMSLIQLICYLGGLAGLWLGVSVMTVSGWLAQLYPFLQKWNCKRKYILLACRRHLKCLLDSLRQRHQAGHSLYRKTASRDYASQSFLDQAASASTDVLSEAYSEAAHSAQSSLLESFPGGNPHYDPSAPPAGPTPAASRPGPECAARCGVRRQAYWSNYSSMSTSSDDISLISSSTNSTSASGSGSAGVLRRMSLCNPGSLARCSQRV